MTSIPTLSITKRELEPLLRDIAYEQEKLKSLMLLMDKESKKYSIAGALEDEIIARR